jgi:hypothetical protein
MYYSIRNQQLINDAPTSIALDNGTIVTGKNLNNNILAEGGYYSVRTDSPPQPQNTVESIFERIVNIDGDFVDIVRTWIPIPAIVPENISARQVRLWLIDNDISLTSVEAAIDTIVDEKLREKTRVEWEYAPYIERNHPLIDSLALYLGLTSEQIDQGFIAASQL